MATKYITQTVDDLDGTVIEDAETLTFSVDGRAYEIDLSADNAQQLRDAFAPYISAGRPLRSERGTARRNQTAPSRQNLAAIRAWAGDNGYTVSSRGRVPHEVIEAYNNAN